jgi:hypothetical protein
MEELNGQQVDKLTLIQGYKISVKGHEEINLYRFQNQMNLYVYAMQLKGEGLEAGGLYIIDKERFFEVLQLANADEITKEEG